MKGLNEVDTHPRGYIPFEEDCWHPLVEKAIQWFRVASERNYCVAQANLSTMYRDGKGVRQDFDLAKTWWNLALEADRTKKLKGQRFYHFKMHR